MHSVSEMKLRHKIGAVVQLVRIHACHAWGRGFESRPHRKRVCRNAKFRHTLLSCVRVSKMQGAEIEDEGSVLKYMTKSEIEEQRSSLLIMT